jgi:hypothetical protein
VRKIDLAEFVGRAEHATIRFLGKATKHRRFHSICFGKRKLTVARCADWISHRQYPQLRQFLPFKSKLSDGDSFHRPSVANDGEPARS